MKDIIKSGLLGLGLVVSLTIAAQNEETIPEQDLETEKVSLTEMSNSLEIIDEKKNIHTP